jgi:hypothetical protein
VHRTPRRFRLTLVRAGAWLSASRASLLARRPIYPPAPPAPAETQVPRPGSGKTGMSARKRALLRQREKEFREGVQRLYQLTSESRGEAEKTSTADVRPFAWSRKRSRSKDWPKSQKIERRAVHTRSQSTCFYAPRSAKVRASFSSCASRR